MAEMIRVAAIDDHRVVLDGLRGWLADLPDITLVATTTTVAEYLAGEPAQVVMLDLNLADQSTPAANVGLLLASGARVMIVSGFADNRFVLDAIEAGAAGYLTKNDDRDVLVDAIRVIAAGGSVMSPELAFALSRDQRPSRPTLSDQERRVLELYGSGMKLGSVARRMDVAEGTIRTYLERIRKKYDQAGRPSPTKVELAARLREDQPWA
jgi:two-component system nitrate/nitrite response regulator NarL